MSLKVQQKRQLLTRKFLSNPYKQRLIYVLKSGNLDSFQNLAFLYIFISHTVVIINVFDTFYDNNLFWLC